MCQTANQHLTRRGVGVCLSSYPQADFIQHTNKSAQTILNERQSLSKNELSALLAKTSVSHFESVLASSVVIQS